jgi:subtilisin family serine protease
MGVATLVCRVDPRVLGELEDAPWALRAEAPRILLPKMDAARGSATGLDAALASIAGGLTGAGVLVAVIDSGVDWRHPDFRHGDGSSRIERFLHAFRPEGALASTYDVYSQADIDAALRAEAGPPDEAKEVPDGDPVGHGTHCAAIAAGNGRGLAGGRFRGVAPQAALMTMRSEPLYDDHTIAGISQAFELAGDRPQSSPSASAATSEPMTAPPPWRSRSTARAARAASSWSPPVTKATTRSTPKASSPSEPTC